MGLSNLWLCILTFLVTSSFAMRNCSIGLHHQTNVHCLTRLRICSATRCENSVLWQHFSTTQKPSLDSIYIHWNDSDSVGQHTNLVSPRQTTILVAQTCQTVISHVVCLGPQKLDNVRPIYTLHTLYISLLESCILPLNSRAHSLLFLLRNLCT